MFRRSPAVAGVLLFASLIFAPLSSASMRDRDDRPPLSERIVRFIKSHIPPMFAPKPADDYPVAPHP